LWVGNNERNIVVNFLQDFVVSKYINFFQGQTGFYWPNHSRETRLSKQEKEEALTKEPS
jgi:hypothetical protein